MTISLEYVELKPVFKPFEKVLNRAIQEYYSPQNRAKHYRAVLQYTLYIDSLCTFTYNKKILICYGILFQICLKINSSSFIIFFLAKVLIASYVKLPVSTRSVLLKTLVKVTGFVVATLV